MHWSEYRLLILRNSNGSRQRKTSSLPLAVWIQIVRAVYLMIEVNALHALNHQSSLIISVWIHVQQASGKTITNARLVRLAARNASILTLAWSAKTTSFYLKTKHVKQLINVWLNLSITRTPCCKSVLNAKVRALSATRMGLAWNVSPPNSWLRVSALTRAPTHLNLQKETSALSRPLRRSTKVYFLLNLASGCICWFVCCSLCWK